MGEIIDRFSHIRYLLHHHPMFTIGILLCAGYVLAKIVAKFKLPHITGFIIAGLFFGKTVSGVVSHEMGESFTIVTEVTLGLIALTIGGEFHWAKLRRLGGPVIVITLVQIAVTFLMVTLGLCIFRLEFPFALMLGVIASATAPAATVAIVQSLRARGRFVDYLYGVVALDDAGCVILFGIVFAFVGSMLGGTGGPAAFEPSMVLFALKEVFLSLVLGIAAGFLIHFSVRRNMNNNEILIISVGIIFISTAFAIVTHLSPLLTNMASGSVIINMSIRNHRIFRTIQPITPPIYALFFILAGTELDPRILLRSDILLLGTIYILFRAIGKYFGVYLGCRLSRAPSRTRRFLGFCMLPQAGVAIGLVLLIEASPMTQSLPADQRLLIGDMVNIVLLSVFVNELVGPPLSKYAIIRGNEMEE
ncbi:cation:proton antiporter [bacterium]|nr:cation:proton antiporter [bacterium]